MVRILTITIVLLACIVAPASGETETGGSAPAMVETAPDTATAAPTAMPTPPAESSRTPVKARESRTRAPLMDVPNVPSPAALTRAIAAWNAHLRAGKKDLEAQKWRAAESHYRAALVLDPSDPDTLSSLARALEGAGALRAATLVLKQAVALTLRPKDQGARWAELARVAEARKLSGAALSAYLRARSMSRTDAFDDRIDALSEVESLPLMSPISLCPDLLDEWGCAPSTRRGEGGMKCSCDLETVLESAEATAGGVITTDRMGVSSLFRNVVLAAAVLRVKGQGIELLDTAYLAVETGGGGWQLVGRMKEGWQPGAAFTARDGRIAEIDFYELAQPARHGSTLIARTVNRSVDGDFARNTIRRLRQESLYICHARGGLTCNRLPLAIRIDTTRMRADGPDLDPKEITQMDWALDYRFDREGRVVISVARGADQMTIGGSLIGTHALEALSGLRAQWPTPLR